MVEVLDRAYFQLSMAAFGRAALAHVLVLIAEAGGRTPIIQPASRRKLCGSKRTGA